MKRQLLTVIGFAVLFGMTEMAWCQYSQTHVTMSSPNRLNMTQTPHVNTTFTVVQVPVRIDVGGVTLIYFILKDANGGSTLAFCKTFNYSEFTMLQKVIKPTGLPNMSGLSFDAQRSLGMPGWNISVKEIYSICSVIRFYQ